MGMAIDVMDGGLREDFGFEHLAWFYSGRRGVHCWVCDDKARKLSNEARSAVATYFEVRVFIKLHVPMPFMNFLSLLIPHSSNTRSIWELIRTRTIIFRVHSILHYLVPTKSLNHNSSKVSYPQKDMAS